MTTPGGLGAFAYTDNSVAAKLSLDIPANSVDILKDLSRFSSELGANMEAAARFGGEYISYLQQLPGIQRQVNDMQDKMLQSLRDTQSVMDQMRISSGGFGGYSPQGMYGPTSQYYSGYAMNMSPMMSQNYAPAASGQSQASRDQASANYTQTMGMSGFFGAPQVGNHPGLISAIPSYTGGQAGNANMPFPFMGGGGYFPYMPAGAVAGQAQSRADLREQEVARQEAVRERQGRHAAPGFAGNVLGGPGYGRHAAEEDNEEGDDPGAAPTRGPHEGAGHGGERHGMAERIRKATENSEGILARVLNAAGPNSGSVGTRIAQLGGVLHSLPSAVKGAGAVGLGLGAGALAFNAVQDVGEEIQSYRNMDVRGHQFGTGIGVQKDVMLMSLNPLITNEQSREVIMGALNAGYQGDSYTSVVDFVKKNLIDMNVDVKDSVELLKNNVELGKQSMTSLGLDLANIATIAKNGGAKTTEEAVSQYKGTSEFLVGQAGAGPASGAVAAQVAAAFNDKLPNGQPNPLHDKAQDIFQGLWSNQGFIAQLRQRNAPGTPQSEVISKLAKQGTLMDNSEEFLITLAERAEQAGGGNEERTAQQFYLLIKAYGFTGDYGESKDLFEQIMSNKQAGTSITKKSQSEIKRATTNKINGRDASTIQTYDQWKTLPGNENKTQREYNVEVLGQDPNAASGGRGPGPNDFQGNVDGGAVANLATSNPNAVAISPDGTMHLLDPSDAQQVIGLSNGTWKVGTPSSPDILEYLNKAKGVRRTDGTLPSGSGPFLGSFKNKPLNGLGTVSNPSDLSSPTQTFKQYEASGGQATYSDTEGSSISKPDDVNTFKGGEGTFTYTAPGSSSFGGASGSFETGKVTIDLTPQARQYLQLNGATPGSVPNTTNDQRANTGYAGATRNSVPTGNK